MSSYYIPAKERSSEIKVSNSRFIATIAPIFTIEQARGFIIRIKKEHLTATHNVPAYVIGHGSTLITHCNDDGEPPGTAGRPVLAVLQGSNLGDAAIVVTRYFGGTKLGTGGLVRAYQAAAQEVLQGLPLARRTWTHLIEMQIPYKWYGRVEQLLEQHHGYIIETQYGVEIKMLARFEVEIYPNFLENLINATNASVQTEIRDTQETLISIEKE